GLGVRAESLLRERAHEVDAAARRRRLLSGQAVGRTDRQAEPAMDAVERALVTQQRLDGGLAFGRVRRHAKRPRERIARGSSSARSAAASFARGPFVAWAGSTARHAARPPCRDALAPRASRARAS